MKTYKNQTEDNAEQNGFKANYSFASDPVMSPDGIDIMRVVDMRTGKNKATTYEVTHFNKEKQVADIKLMNQKEYEEYEKED